MDLRSGRRFVPPSENQASQVCRIRVLDRGPPVTRRATVARSVRWPTRIHDRPSYQRIRSVAAPGHMCGQGVKGTTVVLWFARTWTPLGRTSFCGGLRQVAPDCAAGEHSSEPGARQRGSGARGVDSGQILGRGEIDNLADWSPADALGSVRRLSYGAGDDNPSPTGPGPDDRGAQLFASGTGGAPSGIEQSIPVDRKWKHAIDHGRVIASFSGFLGGALGTPSLATARLRFLDADGRQTGDLLLSGVGPREREDKTGLLPVESRTRVPSGTRTIRVDLSFGATGGGRQHQAYADNLELILSEYSR